MSLVALHIKLTLFPSKVIVSLVIVPVGGPINKYVHNPSVYCRIIYQEKAKGCVCVCEGEGTTLPKKVTHCMWLETSNRAILQRVCLLDSKRFRSFEIVFQTNFLLSQF